MNNIYKTVNRVQSHLITWGTPFSSKGSDVIICISGNPGITDFYTEFGTELYKNTEVPVCVIGHAGHEEVPDLQSNVLKGQEHLFNLEGQIQHKLDLINNFIDKDSKLHVIGHSIGSWLILAMLQKNKSMISRISSVNLLFPTVQKMAKSRNGVFLNNVIRRLHVFFMMLFTLANIIPDFIKNRMVSIYLKLNSLPSNYSERILKFCSPNVGEKVLFLAYDEMDSVTTLNTEILEIIKGRTNVLYSAKDGWAPVSYMDDLRQFEPHLKMKQVNAEHAFVMKSSAEIAEMVSDFIKQNVRGNVMFGDAK